MSSRWRFWCSLSWGISLPPRRINFRSKKCAWKYQSLNWTDRWDILFVENTDSGSLSFVILSCIKDITVKVMNWTSGSHCLKIFPFVIHGLVWFVLFICSKNSKKFSYCSLNDWLPFSWKLDFYWGLFCPLLSLKVKSNFFLYPSRIQLFCFVFF